MRASTSEGPPAGNGAIMVIGRDGKVCAEALAAPCSTTKAAASSSCLMFVPREPGSFSIDASRSASKGHAVSPAIHSPFMAGLDAAIGHFTKDDRSPDLGPVMHGEFFSW